MILHLNGMTVNNYLYGLWNPEVQCRINKGYANNLYPEPNQPNSRIDTYKIHSNSVFPSTPIVS